MPEICEVSLIKFYLQDKLLNRSIFIEVNKEIKEFKIKNIESKGKVLYFILDPKKYIKFGFGLKGHITFEKTKNSKKYFKLDNDEILYFNDPMKSFGSVNILDKDDFLKELSPDFLEDFTYNDLKNRLNRIIKKSKKDKNITELLMSQKNSFGSGLGNYLVAEIMNDAVLSPFTKLSELDEDKLKKLEKSIKLIIKKSILYNEDGYFKNMDFREKIRDELIKKNTIHSNTKIDKPEFKFKVYKRVDDNKVTFSEIIKGRKTYHLKIFSNK